MKNNSFKSVLLYTLPSVLMQMIMSLYVIVDGMFITNYCGDIAIGAINIIFPFMTLYMALGIMISTGGAALISKFRGEGKNDKARSYTTLLFILTILIGLVFSIVGGFFTKEITYLLGGSDLQIDYAVTYAKPLFIFCPIAMMQIFFQSFFVVCERPKLGLISTIGGGIINIVLDYIFMGILDIGILGASIATILGWSVAAFTGIIYYSSKKCILRFAKPMYSFKVILNASSNGLSEMISNLAYAITTLLYNLMFMRYYQEAGASAICIVLYFQYLFSAMIFGYSIGISPTIAFKYGAGDKENIKILVRNSLKLIIAVSIILFIVSNLSINPLSSLFVEKSGEVYNIINEGFFYFSISFLFMGVSIFASTLFTSLQNGLISGLISICRTLIFIVVCILVLPTLFSTNGLWLSVTVAEFLGILLSIFLMIKYKNRYEY